MEIHDFIVKNHVFFETTQKAYIHTNYLEHLENYATINTNWDFMGLPVRE